MPRIAMLHDRDPTEILIEQAGDISAVELAYNELLLGIYQRPERTQGGIIRTAKDLSEDLYQSKEHLVLKMGANVKVTNIPGLKLHDWVVVRPSDCWSIDVNDARCRLAYDDQIRLRIPFPGIVW